MAPDYSKGKIYKIINDIDDEVYVGSTVQRLCDRLAEHRRHSKRCSNMCYNHWNDIGWETIKIILIEDFPCERKEQLEACERYWIEQIGTLNKVIPTRTRNERYEANKDIIKEQRKQYKEANKEVIKEKDKQYHEANKDKINEKKKQYYEANKDAINARRRELRKATKVTV